MPLEIMDQSSSPHLLEEIYFPSEALILQPQLKCYRRQLGFWMPNILPDHQGMVQTPVRKSDASSHLEDVLPNGAVSVDCSKLPPSHVDSVQKQKCYSDEQETAKFSGASLGYVNDNPRTWANLYLHPVSNSMDAKRTNVNGIHEHCLFSSSMSENFTRKLRLSANDSLPHWYADTAAFCNDVEEPFVSDKQIDGQTIGKFLPDEDDLFSGMIDELRYSAHANGSNDEEDFDMFSSGGGMELGGENHLYVCQGNSYSTAGIINGQGSSNGLPASEHPYGEHPSRTLFVRNIYSNVEDSELRILFEQFGDIRTMYTASKHRGFVMISYYDIRAAWNAMSALQNKPLGCRKLDIHYSIPKDYLSEKDINQGTLKVFNLDSMVSSDELHQIFGCFGEIKEIRKTSDKHNHKFIEYYDIRAAETALHALDRSDISGKWIKLELSHQGGAKQCLVHQRSPELLQDELSLCRSPNDKAASDCMVFGSSGIGSCALHRHCHVWSNPKSFQHNPPSPMIWPNSPPYVNNTDCTRKLNGFSRVPPHVLKLNIVSPTHQHHIGSAPAVNPSHWDRQRSYNGESPNAIGFHLDSLGSVGFPTSSPLHLSDVASQNIFSHIGGNFMDMSANYALSSRRHISHIFPARNAVTSTPTSFGTPTMRNLLYRKNKADSFHAEKKKYVLDIDRVLRREDIRTTLMIKNIPNKYTSKMLLAAIDEQQHRGTYDFIYLPIDFKNKCNVGYAFINMSDPLQIIPFHKAFNGKKWEKFNSEKVAYLTYARIQGKAALIAHFQNSSLMNEDKRCRPILFCIDGPNAGEQEPFPMGTTIHPKNYKQGSASILLKEKNLPTKQTFHQAVNPRNQL